MKRPHLFNARSTRLPLLASLDSWIYGLGWNNRLHRIPHPVAHMLLSCSYLYRQGFTEAAYWSAQDLIEASD